MVEIFGNNDSSMRVCFDTNALLGDPYFRSPSWQVLFTQGQEVGYELYLPIIVRDELVFQMRRLVRTASDKYRSWTSECDRLGCTPDGARDLVVDIEECVRAYQEYLGQSPVCTNLIAAPTVTVSDLLTRALEYRLPFERNDKGFRDTLIWLSLIENLQQMPGELAFVTNDNVFYNGDTQELAGALREELNGRGIDPTRLSLCRSIEDFKERFVLQHLTRVEQLLVDNDLKALLASGGPTGLIEQSLHEYLQRTEFDPQEFSNEDAFAATMDVIEDLQFVELHEAIALPNNRALLMCTYSASLTFDLEGYGYQNSVETVEALVEVEFIFDTVQRLLEPELQISDCTLQ